VEAEVSSAESSFQIGDEFAPEEAAEHFDRKKELPATGNPAALVGRDSAARNDAMQVWMVMKVLSPCMQHRQKTDPGTEMSGIAGDLQQGFGGGTEENAINQALVLEGQRCEQLGQREDYVEVLDR
jgi:hypothetical protein